MAEAIVFGIAENIVTDLGSRAIQEIGSAVGVKKELKKLERAVITIRDVLLHAEDLQQVNPEVRTWLKRIKDVAYEADDVIDDFTIEALKKKWLIQGNIIKLVRNFFTSSNPIIFRFKMARRIKNIRERMIEIREDKSFHLETRVEEKMSKKRLPNSARENTHSYVNESEVFGRDDVKEEIVESLLQFDGEEKLSIVSIQGIGGLGKTTLAKLVYNDKRVALNFDLLMWVCVCEDFNVKKITEKIIKSATDNSCIDLEMDQLQYRLRKSLAGKKFLLVLDDVWNEDVNKWDELKDLLLGGAKASKLMVTTRSAKVTRIIRSTSPYNLSELSYDHSWNLFKSRAFNKGQEEKNPNLVKIGREIVEKCGGVPLAIKSVGGLMSSKTSEHEWVQVKNSDVWKENDILPSLRLNYNNLSPSLKQCFTYFSVFPKGYLLEKESIVQEWIALGFIRCYGENQCIEDIGFEYIETLIWISFLQEDIGIQYVLLTMHDLVYDLAQSIAGEECFVLQKETKERIPIGVRHLAVNDEVLPKKTNLQSLFLISPCHFMYVIENICSSFRFLRVLSLFLVSNTKNLPTSIGDLKHLRVLEIYSHLNIMVTLPKSIKKLQRLQSLRFIGRCTLKNLPRDIHLLSELRHIIFRNEASASYSHMPSRLGQLTSLQTLSMFVVGKGKGCKLKDLSRLKCLRGKLAIQNLENVKSARDDANTNLKENSNLEELKLVWNDQEAGKEKNHIDVLEALQPHQHLKCLSIHGYKGEHFPVWLMADPPLLTNLVMVSFRMSGKCEHLPPFGKLQFLEFLELEEMHDLRFIDVERTNMERGGRHQHFPSLKELKLSNFHNLESWVTTEEESLAVALPCLINLTISGCPKLTSIPLLPSLEKCVLDKCNEKLIHSLILQQQQQQQLISSTPSTSSSSGLATPTSILKHLNIEACDELICLSDQVFQGLTGLLELKITKCVSLTTLSGLQHLRSLQTLRLTKCAELDILEGLDGLTSLQSLFIDEIPKLESLPEGLQNATTLTEISIWNCKGLVTMPESLENITILRIIGCWNLMTWPVGLLRNNKSLVRLNLSGCSSLLSLPEELQHLTCLQYLYISFFEDMTTLPEWLRNLTALQSLAIRKCPNLGCLPRSMSCLTSLQGLQIYGCDKLTPRCKKNIGEDWPNIAHIPRIEIDKVLILPQQTTITNSVMLSLFQWYFSKLKSLLPALCRKILMHPRLV